MVSQVLDLGGSIPWRQRRSVLLAVILTAQLMVVLDATIVNVALPHMRTSLHFSSAALSWVLNAYVLAFGGLLLLGARAGDILGRRRVFLAGISLFSLSSLAGGFATAGWELLAARAAQGVGGALAAPAALALLTTVFPEGPERVRAIALFTTVSAAGGATGLVAGGLLTEWASWRWVMFVNVPIGVAVVAAGIAVLGETARRPGRFDVPGALTSTAGMTAVVLGLVEAGTSGWASASTLVPLVAGVALLVGFVRIEKTAPEPVLPLHILVHRTRGGANVARGLGYAGMYGMVFFLTQFLQDVQHHSALVTGLSFLPAPTSVFLSSQVTGRFLSKVISVKAQMLFGSALSIGGLLLASQLRAGTGYPLLFLGLVMMGWGMGTSFVSLTTAGLDGVAPADAGAASGMINVTQQLGAALGLAVLVTVYDSLSGGARVASATVHRMDVTFLAAAAFSVAAFLMIALFVNPGRDSARALSIDDVSVEDLAGLPEVEAVA